MLDAEIGPGAVVDGSIIDKHVVIGPGAVEAAQLAVDALALALQRVGRLLERGLGGLPRDLRLDLLERRHDLGNALAGQVLEIAGLEDADDLIEDLAGAAGVAEA